MNGFNGFIKSIAVHPVIVWIPLVDVPLEATPVIAGWFTNGNANVTLAIELFQNNADPEFVKPQSSMSDILESLKFCFEINGIVPLVTV